MKKLAFSQPNITKTYSQSKASSSEKKGALKIESNDSALENRRTNNYIISEEGPEGSKSICSTTSTHRANNYSEEFLKLRNNDWKHIPRKSNISTNFQYLLGLKAFHQFLVSMMLRETIIFLHNIHYSEKPFIHGYVQLFMCVICTMNEVCK